MLLLSVQPTSPHLHYIDSSLKYTYVRELKPNRSPEIDKWNKVVKNPIGSPYCAAFVGSMLIINGIGTPKASGLAVNYFYKGYNTYTAGSVLNNKNDVKRGDIFIMAKGFTLKGHTGFVLSYDKKTKTIKTVEANTNKAGSRDGDGVYLKERKIAPYAFFRIIGFSRVKE